MLVDYAAKQGPAGTNFMIATPHDRAHPFGLKSHGVGDPRSPTSLSRISSQASMTKSSTVTARFALRHFDVSILDRESREIPVADSSFVTLQPYPSHGYAAS